MTLTDYLNQWKDNERASLIRSIATYLKVTEGAVRHWSNGTRKISPRHVISLEKFLKGKVSRYELRPDIYQEN